MFATPLKERPLRLPALAALTSPQFTQSALLSHEPTAHEGEVVVELVVHTDPTRAPPWQPDQLADTDTRKSVEALGVIALLVINAPSARRAKEKTGNGGKQKGLTTTILRKGLQGSPRLEGGEEWGEQRG